MVGCDSNNSLMTVAIGEGEGNGRTLKNTTSSKQ